MSTQPPAPGLDKLQSELARGDIDAVRRTFLLLNEREIAIVVAEVGEDELVRILSAARTVRRGRKRGRVIVIHGIMGALLDSVDRKGDPDRIWTNYWNLFRGRIDELELDADGEPAKSGYHVRLAGPHRKTYLSMILELDRCWHVRPFSFDWREDIDRSADRLAGEIRAWTQGEPVHIVAHSMGGLVSRRFIQRYGDLWQKMQDPQDPGTGGRLIMLGTPNYGSYAIPLALSGTERLVKYLDKLDVRHKMNALLKILNSFPGTYQMLPSHLIHLGDDHERLFNKTSWGTIPVRTQHLKRARKFHSELHDVVDPERFVYVAGFDRETPHLLKIKKPGEFQLKTTRDGDGRVPHILGLLPNVTTFWVDEGHGALPRNRNVLNGIDDLLIHGRTDALLSAKPARRAATTAKWMPAADVDAIEESAVDAILTPAKRRGRTKESQLSLTDEAKLDALVLGDYLGDPTDSPTLRGDRSRRKKGPSKSSKGKSEIKLDIEVVWGDITKVEGNVYAVGHYEGVLPQNAELALDKVVSSEGADRLVLTEHTRQGTLRGALGDVDYFPWAHSRQQNRTVAVAGMGHPGSFGTHSLRRLINELMLAISSLPNVQTVCMVLIGSGEGTLTIKEAVEGLLHGLVRALCSDQAGTLPRKLRIVELYRHRANEILQELKDAARAESVRDAINLRLRKEIIRTPEGWIAAQDALGVFLDTAARSSALGPRTRAHRAVNVLVKGIQPDDLQKRAHEVLTELGKSKDGKTRKKGRGRSDGLGDVHVTVESVQPPQKNPTRISFVEEKGAIRVAAISDTATVAERIISVDAGLIADLVAQINDPDQEPMENISSFLSRLLLPRDFRDLLHEEGDFVFEVDRSTAQIHWEMLAPEVGDRWSRTPLGVASTVARQLRTTYSPAPQDATVQQDRPRALVVGDPGDPDMEDDLPGARKEALEVRNVLRDYGVEVTALIGAPNASRRGIPRDVAPASRIEVLNQLMHGQFDLLHYCGHGDFDPKDPSRVGWVFASGLLTAREIERIDRVPDLVVANACLSARLSETTEGRRQTKKTRSEAGLLPSLADEFFHLGVRNYIGTSWEVSDIGAILFAQTLYKELLAGNSSGTLGDAVKKARAALHKKEHSFGKLWAAYQHYGDPTAEIRRP